MGTDFRRNLVQRSCRIKRGTPAFMRKATLTNSAPATFFPVFFHETANISRQNALIDSASHIENVSCDVRSVFLARNKPGTGERIPVSSNGKRIRIHVACIVFLAYAQEGHRHFVLDSAQVDIRTTLFSVIPEPSQLFVFHYKRIEILACPGTVKIYACGNALEALPKHPLYGFSQPTNMPLCNDHQYDCFQIDHGRDKGANSLKAPLSISRFS